MSIFVECDENYFINSLFIESVKIWKYDENRYRVRIYCKEDYYMMLGEFKSIDESKYQLRCIFNSETTK